MFDQFTETITDLNEKVQKKERLKERRKSLKEQLKKEQSRKQYLEKKAKKEQGDVEDLKGISLGNFYHSLVGDREEKLDKEKKEALEAKANLDECLESIRDLKESLSSVSQKIEDLGNVEEELNRVLDEKKEAIQESDHPVAEKLQNLSEQIGFLQDRKQEIKEVIDSGRSLRKAIERMIEELNEAKRLGTHDIVWGGWITTAMKHNKLNRAERVGRRVHRRLRRFNHKLSNINNVRKKRKFNRILSGGEKFADFVFDGVFTDWVIQGKIKKSRKQTMELHRSIGKRLQALKSNLQKLDNQLKTLREERDNLIKEAGT